MPPQKKRFLGEMLLEGGFLNKQQLEECLRLQESTGKRLGDILLEKKYISQQVLMNMLEDKFDVPFVDLSRTTLEPALAGLLPVALARRNKLVPVKKDGHVLHVAMEDPRNFAAIDEVRTATRLAIQPMLSAESGILAAIDKLYGNEYAERALQDFKNEFSFEEIAAAAADSGAEDAGGAPIVRLVNAVLEQAIRDGASDIHIEPQPDDVLVRIRVDGQLFESLHAPRGALSALIARIKIMSGMNIAEKRLPQDGRFEVKVLGHEVDVRVSTLPTVNGEKAVLRLLDRNNFLIPKSRLGFTDRNLALFEELLRSPHGIILVTGPTGSGKSTTLYTMLSEINKATDNIVTVEDPVEYTLRGLNQVQVNQKSGLDFATGLRSILRQDPDIIMIGEMRDTETVQIGIRAAITGHLVLSTLHTNDAIGAVYRLVDMGVPAYMVSAALVGVVSQRLVKVICPMCKQPYVPADYELELAGLAGERVPPGTRVPAQYYRGQGCAACGGTGYKGRMAVHEILMMDIKLREMIHAEASSGALRDYAVSRGMSTLRNECVSLVESGKTTLSEMINIAHGSV